MIQILGVKVNNLAHYSLMIEKFTLKNHTLMKTLTLLGLLLFSITFSTAQIDLQLELISDVFFEPVDITNAGDAACLILVIAVSLQ